MEHTHTHTPTPSPPPAARACLIPTMQNLLTSFMHSQMPRTNYSPDDEANRNCLECVGQLLEALATPTVGATPADVELVTPLLHPLIQLCRQLPKINPLAVSGRLPTLVTSVQIRLVHAVDSFS